MPIKKYLPFLCCLFVFALSGKMFCVDGPHLEAKQLLLEAHGASGLSTLVSYEFTGIVVINPGTENEKKGTITIYHDHERWRSELLVETYQEIKLTRDSKLYIARSTPMPIPQLGKLAEADHFWDKLADDGDTKLGDVGRKKAQGQPANCFEVKGEQHHRLCFDPERKFLLENLDQRRAVEFTNYSEIEGLWVPGKITVLLELEKLEKPVLVIENIKVRKAQFAETVFSVPAKAMEFDTCEKVTPATPLRTVAPDFSNAVIRRNAGSPIINAYGIVTRDGTLENLKMMTSDTDVQQVVLETVKKWRFTPAMCGTTPVASEREFPVFVTSDGGSGNMDVSGGRRGR
jgi:hypothetical protein